MKRVTFLALLTAFFAVGCDTDPVEEADRFLASYSTTYQEMQYTAAEAEWKSNTYIVEGDTVTGAATRAANEALADFTGSAENIEQARGHLTHREVLDPLQVKQLEKVLYLAANNPQTVPEAVQRRIQLETELNDKLFGFDFKIDGNSVSTNEIDRILREERRPAARRKAWLASKEVGTVLRDGLAEVRDLRNETVQALGYDNYFAYQVSDYGMTADEMMALMRQINEELYPLYRELHTWARYTLAARYEAPVPDLLPADWLPNRWGQDWSSLVSVEGADINAGLAPWSGEDLVQQAERFYVSLGFEPLPRSFYLKSSLFPLPPDAEHKKNNHASAWHMDIDKDVRSLMSVENNAEWYETTHHELGHIYYYMSYSTPDVPLLLREGANRGFHEAIGSMLGLAAMQRPFLAHVGLLPDTVSDPKTDMQALLREALNYVVFIPFSTGTITGFERDLYTDNLPADRFNDRWWTLAARYQGILPPVRRGPESADAATKTHTINDAAQYYDYALSQLILFQVHQHIATNILGQDAHATNYFGSKGVGDYLRMILAPGATADWRQLLREATGSDLSAKAMIDYFEPLMGYLKEQNRGRQHTLPAPDAG